MICNRLPRMDLVMELHSWSTHDSHRPQILDPVLPSVTSTLS